MTRGTSVPDTDETTPDSIAVFHKLVEAPWEDPRNAPANLRKLADQAKKVGARRAQVTTGMLGLYTQLSEMPAGYQVPAHTHSAHELMVILDGGCTIVDGPTLTAGDMVEIPAGTDYGFDVDADGIRFIVVRPDVSTTKIAKTTGADQPSQENDNA